jgi:putative ABC transport system permease protein
MNYFLFAIRNLKRKGVRSWLTLIGIFIGIAAVVSLVTIGAGLKAAVNSQFGVSSTEVITVEAGGIDYGAPGSGSVNPLTKQDAEAIEKLGSVKTAIPRNVRTGKIEYGDAVGFGYGTTVIRGEEDQLYEILDLKSDRGRLLESSDSRKIMVGYGLHYNADKEGDGRYLLPGKTILVNDEKFEIVGIVEKQGTFMLDYVVWMHDDEMESLMNYGDEADLISVQVKDKDLMEKTKEDIEKLMRKRRDVKVGKEDFEVSTPESTLEDVNSILNGIQAFVIIIASISILIGAIGIINTMVTSVLERRREIGIMKAIGARNSQIFMQFFVESGMLGLIGGAAGILFGLLLGYAGSYGIIQFIGPENFVGSEALPKLNLILIFFSLLGSFLIGSIAGIFPAMRAANQNPVDALRS